MKVTKSRDCRLPRTKGIFRRGDGITCARARRAARRTGRSSARDGGGERRAAAKDPYGFTLRPYPLLFTVRAPGGFEAGWGPLIVVHWTGTRTGTGSRPCRAALQPPRARPSETTDDRDRRQHWSPRNATPDNSKLTTHLPGFSLFMLALSGLMRSSSHPRPCRPLPCHHRMRRKTP